jgi:5'-3' exonuclease
MGVPSFFRWLQLHYPLTVKPWGDVHNRQCDNFYLDLNSIIHPCSHPEGQPQPESEDAILHAISKNIDYLMTLVKPKRLIYLAIDGVAPKAKMNQQRARRFRSSKLTTEKLNQIAHAVTRMKKDFIVERYHFDSNSITPGTLFMYNLSKYLELYIILRKKTHRLWENVTVVLSDANVPGEGEHKIMQFIRDEKLKLDYNPNIHHVMYGADADLIMLGLATHENFFSIIREEFNFKKSMLCDLCNQVGHLLTTCKGTVSKVKVKETRVNYLGVDLTQLRWHLKRELLGGDFKRRINDWVFLCFFVGNDFLPSIQGLSIQKGAIDKLVEIYNDGDQYVTDGDKIDIPYILKIMNRISRVDEYHVKSKDRGAYYNAKFKRNSKSFKTDVINHYIKGLCWVLKYYFTGCPSWDWYFPYLYGPFASDFKYATRETCRFSKNTKPATPFEQLMSTLPSSSAYLLPNNIGDLMTTKLADFYPLDFEIDLNGKQYEWQGVALLPFIDMKRLKSNLKNKYKSLSPIDTLRNAEHEARYF